MDYYSWKTIAAAPACRAMRAGAEVWALPNGGFFSGGRTYTHGLRTKRGTCYVVCREVMREVDCTRFDMLAEQGAKAAPEQKGTLVMSTNNPKTVQTARRKLDMIKNAGTPSLCYELAMFMHGWLEALWTEGLIDRPTWGDLRAEAEAIREQRTTWLESVAKYGEPAD